MRRSLVSLVAAAGLALAACGTTGSDARTSSSTTVSVGTPATLVPQPPQTERQPNNPDAADPDQLSHLLVGSGIPAGFTRQPDSVGDTGPSDLDKAVRDQGGTDPAADREFLRRNHFRRGYQRLWQDSAGDQLVAFLYEFATADGAKAEQVETTGLDFGGKPPESQFSIAGVPGSLGFSTFGDDGKRATFLLFTKGGFEVQLLLVQRDLPGAIKTLKDLGRRQYDLLPS